MIQRQAELSAREKNGYRCQSTACRYQHHSDSLIRAYTYATLSCVEVHSLTCIRTHVLADPTSFEEPLLDTTISVTMEENGGLISVTQVGLGLIANQDVLARCIAAAKERRLVIGRQVLNT